ncbi:DUF262 domain-containing protein [Flavobacterium sp. WV_118_3]|uniref:DUF262 domain-containing protein n=1 Tax=Flavobacterium sp. WV_118_3 TaxID=3151764 RepID=UPI00321904B0
MAYKSKSILQIVKEIEESKVFLPALQRKFVWGKPQIELLFDSLMRNFPIGTFLFWNLNKEVANNYVFYEFLREYDQRNPYNIKKSGSFLNTEIIGVLDGQQRLSSMYIGLQGTHTEKAPYMRWADDNAYRKSKLYLNLLSLPYRVNTENDIETIEEQNFEFRFLTDGESEDWIYRKIKQQDENENERVLEDNMFWFKVGDILTWKADPEIDVIIDSFISKCKTQKQKDILNEKRRLVKKTLETLYKRISSDQLINYFEIDKQDLEDILKIFIRVNSGGTQLNKTDLLFSTIVATWDNGRDEIEALLQKINRKGDGFGFSNEFLMRSCLVLTDAPILYKVNSFKSENVQKIKDEWRKIANAIEQTVELLVEFGFNQSLLTSQNATIIIAYYIYKSGVINDTTKIDIKKYLIHSLLNGIYGSSQDQLIAFLRNFFRTQSKDENGKAVYKLKNNYFSFEEILKLELPSKKSLYITEIELDNFMSYRKGASSFFVLSLLYPNLKYKEVQFHQDHIHPASKFDIDNFNLIGLNKEEHDEWLKRRDSIPNLQLLEGRQNESKNATAFNIWLSRKNEYDQTHFKTSNYIPEDISIEFKDFLIFYEKRKTKLKEELKKVLAINNDAQITSEEFLEQEAIADED